jgi:hypothetical protein
VCQGDVAKWLRQGSAKPLFSGPNPLVASILSSYAGVAELADAEDLKSSALKRLVGSRPSPGTTKLDSDLAVREKFLAAFFIADFFIYICLTNRSPGHYEASDREATERQAQKWQAVEALREFKEKYPNRNR